MIQSGKRYNCEVLRETSTYILLKDTGHSSNYMSMTNAAEDVVKDFAVPGRRILYYDSLNELGEIVVEGGQFAGFRFMSEEQFAALR